MTDDKWQEVVLHVLERLKTVPRYEAERESFFKHFGLIEADDAEVAKSNYHGRAKCFEYHQESRDSLRVLVFSRLEPHA